MRSRNCEKQLLALSCLPVRLSVRMEQLGSHWRVFRETCLMIFRKSIEEIKFHLSLTRMLGTLHEDLRTFMTKYPSVLLILRSVSGKSCRENQNTPFSFNNFLRTSCRLWDNVEKFCTAEEATDDNTLRRIRCSYWTKKATNTHSQYAIFTAFSLNLWSCEAPQCYLIRWYTYIVCLVVRSAIMIDT